MKMYQQEIKPSMDLEVIKLLFCSNCKNNLPRLLYLRSNKILTFKMRCSCFDLLDFMDNTDSNNTFSLCPKHNEIANQYCSNCSAYLCKECLLSHSAMYSTSHKFLTEQKEINESFCIKHSLNFLYYCRTCRNNICRQCQKDHPGHQFTTIKQVDTASIYKTNCRLFTNIMETNKQRTDHFLQRLQTEINELNQRLYNINIMKEDIVKAYTINQTRNEKLMNLYKNLYESAISSKNQPSFQMTRLFNRIIGQDNKNYEQHKTIDKEFEALSHDLQKKYILSQRKGRNECEVVFDGHDSTVHSLIQLPNGKLASGSADSTIKIWETSVVDCMVTLIGHTSTVNTMINLLDGRIASGSNDCTIKLWNVARYDCDKTLTGHSEGVLCLVELNKSEMASGSLDKSIIIWNLMGMNIKARLTGHYWGVYSIIKMKNGLLASGSRDKCIKIWNLKTNECKGNIYGHEDIVSCLLQLNDGKLASGSYDNSIRIWNSPKHDLKMILNSHSSYVLCLLLLTDGRMASCSYDNTIKLWDSEVFQCKVTLTGYDNNIWCLLQLHDGSLVSCDKAIQIWSV